MVLLRESLTETVTCVKPKGNDEPLAFVEVTEGVSPQLSRPVTVGHE